MSKLIVIEGTDGSGKQTQSDLLKNFFEKNNLKFKNFSFPNYQSESSALVKMYLNGDFGDNVYDINPYIASTFFAVDRYATFFKNIKKYYDNDEIILLDRYTTANMIHQASKIGDESERNKFLDWLDDLEFVKFGLPKPDVVIFLNMPPEKSQQLMKDRLNKINDSEKKDIHESNQDYLKKCYDISFDIAIKNNWIIIDCTKDNAIRTIEDIHNEILKHLKGRVF